MEDEDAGFSDCDSDFVEDDDDARGPTPGAIKGKSGKRSALSAIEAELGLLDLPKTFADSSKTSSLPLSISAKKRRRKKLKEKSFIQDPFATNSAPGSSTVVSGVPSSTGNQRLFPSAADNSWMSKMGLGKTSSPSSVSSSSPVVVTFTTKRKGLSSALAATLKTAINDDDDGLDLDMERTRLEILKYETEKTKGKKASAAKMKEYLESLGARPKSAGAYRNPEHRRNYVVKKTKSEVKERRIRKEMGLKVDNHDERRKDAKNGSKRKRKELGAVNAVGRWNDKTATLKVKK